MAGEKRPFDDPTLLAYSKEHVSYEIRMFLDLHQFRETHGVANLSPGALEVLRNALLEATALHLRNLLEFFYPRRKKPRRTDVHAFDFIPHWNDHRPELSDALDDAWTRVDRRLAHLTTGRLDPGHEDRRGWDFAKLREELVPVLRCFVRHASPSRLDPVVRRLLDRHGIVDR